jgi:hypothetical protein
LHSNRIQGLNIQCNEICIRFSLPPSLERGNIALFEFGGAQIKLVQSIHARKKELSSPNARYRARLREFYPTGLPYNDVTDGAIESSKLEEQLQLDDYETDGFRGRDREVASLICKDNDATNPRRKDKDFRPGIDSSGI